MTEPPACKPVKIGTTVRASLTYLQKNAEEHTTMKTNTPPPEAPPLPEWLIEMRRKFDAYPGRLTKPPFQSYWQGFGHCLQAVENHLAVTPAEQARIQGEKPHCSVCGREARPNVPRLGWEAGAVHADDSSFLCNVPDATKKASTPPKQFHPSGLEIEGLETPAVDALAKAWPQPPVTDSQSETPRCDSLEISLRRKAGPVHELLAEELDAWDNLARALERELAASEAKVREMSHVDRTNADLVCTCNFMEKQLRDIREAVTGWDSEAAFLCGPDDHSFDKAIGKVYHDISQQIRAILGQ